MQKRPSSFFLPILCSFILHFSPFGFRSQVGQVAPRWSVPTSGGTHGRAGVVMTCKGGVFLLFRVAAASGTWWTTTTRMAITTMSHVIGAAAGASLQLCRKRRGISGGSVRIHSGQQPGVQTGRWPRQRSSVGDEARVTTAMRGRRRDDGIVFVERGCAFMFRCCVFKGRLGQRSW